MRVNIPKSVKSSPSIWPHCNFGNGFSLLETLISLFILSFCLLGIVATLSKALSQAQNSYLRTVGTIEAANLAEALKANLLSSYFPIWNLQITQIFPHGIGQYKTISKGHEISICWQVKLSNQECIKIITI